MIKQQPLAVDKKKILELYLVTVSPNIVVQIFILHLDEDHFDFRHTNPVNAINITTSIILPTMD